MCDLLFKIDIVNGKANIPWILWTILTWKLSTWTKNTNEGKGGLIK